MSCIGTRFYHVIILQLKFKKGIKLQLRFTLTKEIRFHGTLFTYTEESGEEGLRRLQRNRVKSEHLGSEDNSVSIGVMGLCTCSVWLWETGYKYETEVHIKEPNTPSKMGKTY